MASAAATIRTRRAPDRWYRRRRTECVRRGVRHRIARTGVEATDRPGKHRWTVERTLAWLARDRRLTIRSERLVAVHRGLLHLACARVCFNCLRRV